MIAASRFIVESTDLGAWLAARRTGVTATEVAKASTPAGLTEALEARRSGVELDDNEYMRFGRDNESWLAGWVKRETGIMPNRWLIAAENDLRHMATLDGLSLDHTQIAEIKTGGTEPGKKPPMAHYRQMQWQMYCTDTDHGFYVFMLRATVNGVMVPAWMEPRMIPVQRDEKTIAELKETAHLLLSADYEWSAA